ncbi:MAG: sigma 54-interacting transcriptional regulator [Synergistaceae bacterium]|jgi:PAS domain S-box-containing protein|nr:sigma 54-interacting transcriptional regulator [Synergistaceae bacterium]
MQTRKAAYYHSNAEHIIGDIQDPLNILLDAVLESSYDGIYITDGNADTIKINTSYEIISGLKRSDVIGRNMRDLVAGGLISVSGTLLALEKRESITLEQKFKTGKQAVITSTPTFDDQDNIVMVVTNVRDITEIWKLRDQLHKEEELAKRQLSELEIIRKQIMGVGNMIAVDPTMLQTMLVVNKVAPMETTVLLLGETGVGKEIIASYIHQNSPRKDRPIIKVNCGAIPAQLVESELFGYEAGSFTGAKKDGKMGLVEIANEGTIFLDEIGDLPLDVQVKLLRLLQEKEIQRIGSTVSRKVDVRIIGATNRDLQKMVEVKEFRKDLYYRLSVLPLTVPPLRDRPGDILPLAEAFLAELNLHYRFQKKFAPSAVYEIQSYEWPGNIRELRNVIERAVILSSEENIQPRDLGIFKEKPVEPGALSSLGQPLNLKQMLMDIERDYIDTAYGMYRNVRKAANSLSMDAATYVRKRRKYGGSGTLRTNIVNK